MKTLANAFVVWYNSPGVSFFSENIWHRIPLHVRTKLARKLEQRATIASSVSGKTFRNLV